MLAPGPGSPRSVAIMAGRNPIETDGVAPTSLPPAFRPTPIGASVADLGPGIIPVREGDFSSGSMFIIFNI
jgi:hypothetical protein